MTSTKNEWSTEIGEVGYGVINVRGYRLSDLIENLTFTEAVFLTIRGRLPDKRETRVFNAVLCAILEHGFYAPTTVATRVVSSASPESIIPSLAGGLLTVGSVTVSPQHTGELILEALKVGKQEGLEGQELASVIGRKWAAAKKRLPGVGHPLHPEGDPRAISLKKVAQENGIWGEKAELFEQIRDEFVKLTNKQLPINVDGAMGMVLSELGFSPKEMPGIASMSFLPGMIAHSVEETSGRIKLRIIEGEYTGEAERDLPTEYQRGAKV
jgi:citryl-CoA lyase